MPQINILDIVKDLLAFRHCKIVLEKTGGIEKHAADGEDRQNPVEFSQLLFREGSHFPECHCGKNVANL
jgi:hypothetical protein